MSEATSAPKRRLALWLAIPTVVMLVVGVPLMWLYYQREADLRDLQAALAETDALEPDGWRLEDLERQRRHIPDEENSALVMLRAYALEEKDWPSWWHNSPHVSIYSCEEKSDWESMLSLQEVPPNYLLNGTQFNILRNEICRNHRQLAALAALDGKLSGRFPHTIKSPAILVDYDNHRKLQKLVNALDFQARVKAQEGDFEAAWQSLTRSVFAIRACGDECATIPLVMRMAGGHVFAQSTEAVMALGPTQEDHLRTLQELVRIESQEPLLQRLLRAERAFVDRYHEELSAGLISFSQFANLSRQPSGFLDDTLTDYYLQFSYGSIPLKRARALRHFNKLQSLATESQDAVVISVAAAGFTTDTRHPLDHFLIDPSFRVIRAYGRHAAILRCLQVALALERYRLRNGCWPQSLDELVPQFLENVPLDPFDGRPLRYADTAEGKVVYSVGFNQVDNRGNVGDGSSKNSDVGLRLYDPEHRRKPPLDDRVTAAEP